MWLGMWLDLRLETRLDLRKQGMIQYTRASGWWHRWRQISKPKVAQLTTGKPNYMHTGAHTNRVLVHEGIVAIAVRTLAAAERHAVGVRGVLVTARITPEVRIALLVVAAVESGYFSAVPVRSCDGGGREPESHCCVLTV